MYNNLGGQGPVTSDPAVMRFANVGTAYDSFGLPFMFDIELSTTTSYTAHDPSANGFTNNKFAQVNLACGHTVGLRATMKRSCATAPSCNACTGLPTASYIQCYAAGCACVGTTVYLPSECQYANVVSFKAAYSCAAMNDVIVLPRSALATLTVFDLDTSPDGTYLEQITVPDYEYFKTPLRPSSGADISSTVYANLLTRTFTGTQPGTDPDTGDNPTDPLALTDEQASRGVAFYFWPRLGYIEANFTVTYLGTGNCTGRSLMFAGNSALCAPPPPMPSQPPPLSVKTVS